ncbi:hypothetical protein SMKI_11G0050 [Saccharomyces mikatae IFO 1815]|uniref:Uncharacterized protein n=1 Tax=Saccharomyces mikatae IFO 1815 TaxID=226126 RepID=A0AA35NBG9_SACMI|nr:uncharacterized protein SMKI_11G0050 [Saccharomyces mikatae IFO 1815]CAI4034560.1 hypothetical protein SMKI_11G0050 [Saccharomyces mikatae IFO 1815]
MRPSPALAGLKVSYLTQLPEVATPNDRYLNCHLIAKMKDTDIEDVKSMGLLSPKHLESQETVLPQDIFRNKFTWYSYEIYKSLAFRIWLLLWLPISVWWKMSKNWAYPFVASIFLFLGLAFLPCSHLLFRKRALSKQLTEFSKIITRNAPGTNADDWKNVAASLNSYLYESKAWNTRHFFFDAWDCQEAFRRNILEPFFLQKDEAARIKSFKESVPYIEEALQTYFAEVDKRWKLFNSEKSWSPADLENAQLPKETHRFKLTWFLKRIFSIFSLKPFLNILVYIYVSREMNLLLHTLYLRLIFIMMVEGFQNLRISLMGMEHKMQFLSTIMNEQKTGANGWDEIAKKMNRYLFEKKVWKNEEFFFDGTDCERFFSGRFYRLLFSKKSMSLVPLNVELWPYIKEAQLARNEQPLV